MNGYEQTAYGDLGLIRRAVQDIAKSTGEIADCLRVLADTSSDQATATVGISEMIHHHMSDLVEAVKRNGA